MIYAVKLVIICAYQINNIHLPKLMSNSFWINQVIYELLSS